MTAKKTKEWTKKGIALKLVALIVPLTALFIVLLLLGFYAIWALKGDGVGINYAGQTRYRSYQLAVLVNEYPALQGGAQDKARGTILNLTKEFEDILYGLRDGNETLGLKGCKVPKAESFFDYNDPWWQFDRHIKDYNERIKPLILHVLETPSQEESAAALKIYNKAVPPFVNDVNRTVSLLSVLSEKKISRFRNVEFILLGLFLGTIGMSFFLAQSFNSMTREVQASRNLVNEVLGNIGSFVRIVDPKVHRVIFQNKPLQAINPQGLERPCYTVLCRETACEHCTSAEAIEKKRDFAKEEEVPGGIFYEVHSFPFPNPDGTVTNAIEVIKDITARKKMEGELEDSRTQLLESQKMATVGHLSLGIAHHINNPLSGINMSAEVLIRRVEEVKDGPIYGEIKDHIIRIIENSRRCEAVMKDLRNISNMPKPKRLPMHLNEALEHVLNGMTTQLGPRNIQFVKGLSTTIPRVLGSPSQLETVFINLISNAIDEMPKGGTLTVKTEHLASEGKIEVTISDTGPGINEKDLPHLFDPYFILKIRPAGRCTGLELALVQLTVQSYGGTIEADSVEGKGTTFKVRLPVYQETGTAEEKALKAGLVA